MRNNNKENTIDQGKSKRNYLPYDNRVRLPIKKNLIKEHIDATILDYGQFTKARPTIAKKFGVSERYVTQIYSEIKQDPSYDVSQKQGFTVIIKFSCLAKSYQAEIFHQSNSNKNNIKSLYVNTPISPKGAPAVLENKEPKEKKTIKGEHQSLILRLGTKYRWHYEKQTLKLFAYPTFIIKQASEELSSAIAEYARERQGIRSTYRYMKKICDTLMERQGIKPLWKLYYRARSIIRVRPNNQKLSMKTSPIAPAPFRPEKRIIHTVVPTKEQSEVVLQQSPEEKQAHFKKIIFGSRTIADKALRKIFVEYGYREIFNEIPNDAKLKEYGFA